MLFFLGKKERKEDKILLRQLSAPIYRRPNRQTVCGMLFENEAEIALKSKQGAGGGKEESRCRGLVKRGTPAENDGAVTFPISYLLLFPGTFRGGICCSVGFLWCSRDRKTKF